VIPAGKIGNDKPITITRESLVFRQTAAVVQRKHSDPVRGYELCAPIFREPNRPRILLTVSVDYTIKQDGPRKGGMKHGQVLLAFRMVDSSRSPDCKRSSLGRRRALFPPHPSGSGEEGAAVCRGASFSEGID